jgi:hypothetical protein
MSELQLDWRYPALKGNFAVNDSIRKDTLKLATDEAKSTKPTMPYLKGKPPLVPVVYRELELSQ